MALGTSSKRYAKALVSHSIEKGILDVMFDEINFLINILEESVDLKEFISNPTISRENKTKLLNELTYQSLPNISILLNLLSINNRIDMLLEVCKVFVNQYNDHNNIVEVTVTTPVEISENLEKTIETFLSFFDLIKLLLINKNDDYIQHDHFLINEKINLDERI